MKPILHFFDKLEDRVRGYLSHYPILYAIVGGVGVVLFWRGVWLTTDEAVVLVAASQAMGGAATINVPGAAWWDGPLSFFVGLAILLVTGVFVSDFIGNEIIITGVRGDKKISEKTEQEMRVEVGAIEEIKKEVKKISEKLDTPKK